MKIIKAVILAFSLALTAVSQASRPREAVVPGTRVRLTPPSGFAPSTQIPGFVYEDLGASILITEMPGPISELSPGFIDSRALRRRGMKLLSKQEVTVNNQTGWLFYLEQTASGVEYRKWIMLLGDEQAALLVTGNFSQGTGSTSVTRNNLQECACSKNRHVRNLKIQRLSLLTIDKLNGYEIIAQGNDKRSGRPLVVYFDSSL